MEESYYILSGQGRITIENETDILNTGDVVLIPEKAVHQLANVSNDEPY